ncbi:MAG: O-antigen ligase family protein [Anaerolineae bacterium]|nr:O-antigen ligase family protein [Anaerolineae bacterium]
MCAIVGLTAILVCDLADHATRWRGFEENPSHGAPSQRLVANVALQQYADERSLVEALQSLRDLGVTVVRQSIAWAEVEPVPGEYDWAPWDVLLPIVQAQRLGLIVVLETSPAWARPLWESGNVWAPPSSPENYARFAAAFARRYGHFVQAYQIWDNPNIRPYWGLGDIDPGGYVELLGAASPAIRAVDAHALIIAGGLAPNTESGGRNMSDLLFLREMYRRGAGAYFDVLGAKPYGFWSGPQDRRVSPALLNFSRVILLREEMRRRGESHKPIWALEGGWCALPPDWDSEACPQGSDLPEVQAARVGQALVRAQCEWPWLPLVAVGHLQPDAPASDPIWGFALRTSDGEPTLLARYLQRMHSQRIARAADSLCVPSAPSWRNRVLELTLGLLGLVSLALAGWQLGEDVPWRNLWGRVAGWFARWPMMLRSALVVGLFWALAASSSPILRLVSLGLYALGACLEPDLALLVAVACIPLAPVHTRLGPGSFSLAEVSLIVAWAAHLWTRMLQPSAAPRQRWPDRLRRVSYVDWGVVALVALGIVTSWRAEYGRVAFRELRTVVFEGALLYALIRRRVRASRMLVQVADVLFFSGVIVALFALIAYRWPEGVIEAGGVRRARGFFGSPNNLALYMERILPIGIAVAASDVHRRRRSIFALGAMAIATIILLTFSRGAWLLGVPTALALIAAFSRRKRGVLVACALVLLGLLGILLGPALFGQVSAPERLASLLDIGEGTVGLRIKLWRASLDMLRDHPWFGVGLDNFLYYYGDYIQPGAEIDRWLSHPHNLVLDFWLRLGIGGALVSGLLIVGFLRTSLHALTHLRHGLMRAFTLGFTAALGAMLVHGLIDASFFVVELGFWFMLALGWISQASSCLVDEQSDEI